MINQFRRRQQSHTKKESAKQPTAVTGRGKKTKQKLAHNSNSIRILK
jgi:hypothetical protein